MAVDWNHQQRHQISEEENERFLISVTRQKKRLIRSVHIRHFVLTKRSLHQSIQIFVLDNKEKEHAHHSAGFFTNPTKRTAFEFKEEDSKESYTADILKVDSRFVSLVRWLGDNHINVRLSGENTAEGYAVYKIREIAFGGGTKLSAEDGFLQFMIDRLLASDAPAEEAEDEDKEELGDDMKITSLQSITDFLTCAGKTLPDNIRLWARRNLAVARSHEVSPRGEAPCAACAFYYDEYPVEEQLF